MVDLTFPSDVLQKLKPDLETLGFTISPEIIISRISWSVETRMTALTRDMERIYLIHLKRNVIDVNKPKLIDLQAMAFLEYCVPEAGSPKAGFLVVMSEGLDAPSSPVEQIIKTWRRHGINVQFIPWRRINDLPPPGAETRVGEVAEMLDVLPSSMSMGVPQKIERIDVQVIVRIMTDIASTNMGGPEQFFKDLIERTALPASTQSRALAGLRGGSTLPDAYARELVQWAVARGRFTPEGGTARLTVLGEIIKELAEECGDDERAQLGRIAERYQLLDDLTLRKLGKTN